MATGELDSRINGIDLPDIPLWAIWSLQQYAKAYGREDASAKYLPEVRDILNFILSQRHPLLKVDSNGMVNTEGTEKPCHG